MTALQEILKAEAERVLDYAKQYVEQADAAATWCELMKDTWQGSGFHRCNWFG